MKKKMKPVSRLQARAVEKKFTPALKALSSHMFNTGDVTDDFLGYKVPAGDFTDARGRKWQLQAHAVCAKSSMIRKDEVKPMIRKGAWGLKIRVFFKYLIDWSERKV